MDLSLRCHCDGAVAPGDLNRIGVEKQASGGPTWLGPESGTKERSGGSTKRRYERADTCCGRCSASEADGTAEHESGHRGNTLWFFSLCGVASDAASRVWETACLWGGVGVPAPNWYRSGECFLAHFLSLPDFDSGAIDESHAKACRSEGSRASHNEKLNQKTHILKHRTDLLVNKLTTRTSWRKDNISPRKLGQ